MSGDVSGSVGESAHGAGARRFDLRTAAAVLIGLTAPLVIFGSGFTAATFGLAALVCLFELRDASVRGRMKAVSTTPTAKIFALCMLWWAFTVPFSLDLGSSVQTYLRVIAFVALALLSTVVMLRRDRLADVLELAFLAGMAAVLLLAVAGIHLQGVWMAPFEAGRDYEVTPGRYFKGYGSVCALAIPVFIWLAYRRDGLRRLLALAGLVLAAVVMLGDGTNPSLSGLAGLLGGLALVAVAWVFLKVATPWRYVVAGLSALAVLLPVLAIVALVPRPPVTVEDQASPPLPFVDFHRHVIWGFTLEQIEKHPIVGNGINAVNNAPGGKVQVLDIGQEYMPAHPHNWVLEVTSETGIPGMVLFAAVLVAVLWVLISAAAAGYSGAYAMIATFGVFWASSLFNFSIWSAWWQVTFLALFMIPGLDVVRSGGWRCVVPDRMR